MKRNIRLSFFGIVLFLNQASFFRINGTELDKRFYDNTKIKKAIQLPNSNIISYRVEGNVNLLVMLGDNIHVYRSLSDLHIAILMNDHEKIKSLLNADVNDELMKELIKFAKEFADKETIENLEIFLKKKKKYSAAQDQVGSLFISMFEDQCEI